MSGSTSGSTTLNFTTGLFGGNVTSTGPTEGVDLDGILAAAQAAQATCDADVITCANTVASLNASSAAVVAATASGLGSISSAQTLALGAISDASTAAVGTVNNTISNIGTYVSAAAGSASAAAASSSSAAAYSSTSGTAANAASSSASLSAGSASAALASAGAASSSQTLAATSATAAGSSALGAASSASGAAAAATTAVNAAVTPLQTSVGTLSTAVTALQTAPPNPVVDGTGNTLTAQNVLTGQSLLSGGLLESGTAGRIEALSRDRQVTLRHDTTNAATTLVGALSVGGATALSGALSVSGTTALGGSLSVGGGINATGPVVSNGVTLGGGGAPSGAAFTDSLGNTLTAASATSGQAIVAGAVHEVGSDGKFRVQSRDRQNVFVVDPATASAFVSGNLTVGGSILGTVAAGAATTFSAAELAAFDATCLAYSAQAKTRSNTTAQRFLTQWNGQILCGASRANGTQGQPAVSLTQPLDNYSVGQNTQGQHFLPAVAGWSSLVDSTVRPLVAVNSNNNVNAVSVLRTGSLVVTAPVSITTDGSTSGTISFTQSGLDLTTTFANNDTFQMLGWVTATANNAQTTTSNMFTVKAVSANQIKTKEIPVATSAAAIAAGVPLVTSAAESNITFAQTGYQQFGEDPSVAANNELRKQYLNYKGLTADSARLMLVNGCAIAGPVALQSPANPAFGSINPNPAYFTRFSNLFTAMQTAAGAPGGSLPAGSFAIQTVCGAIGGDDGSCITGPADYRAMVDWWLTSICSLAKTTTAQTSEPFQYMSAHSGNNLTEAGPPLNWNTGQSPNQYDLRLNAGNLYRCATPITSTTTAPTGTGQGIVDGSGSWNYVSAAPTSYPAAPAAMGILQLLGCDPTTGFSSTYAGKNPNRYCYGPDYGWPDRGTHGTNKSYAAIGCMIAKVRTKVELLGQGFLPCHVIQVKVRAAQVAVGCNVPEPPLQVRSPLYYTQPQVWADWGFYATDKNGVLTITSIALSGFSQVVINFNRVVDVATFGLRYGDNITATTHNGAGMICDSDPWQPALNKYTFNLGSGDLLADTFPSAGGLVQNGVAYPMYNWLCPGAWAGVAA